MVSPVSSVCDTKAAKRPTNLTVNADLLQQAKELRINLSALLEAALTEELRQRKAAAWAAENAQAIDSYNEAVLKNGLFSDGQRTF